MSPTALRMHGASAIFQQLVAIASTAAQLAAEGPHLIAHALAELHERLHDAVHPVGVLEEALLVLPDAPLGQPRGLPAWGLRD